MANNKHLTLDERTTIESMLKHKTSFKEIGRFLDKDPSTISKEIRAHLLAKRSGYKHINFNACTHRFSCENSRICSPCHAQRRYKLCKNCSMCNTFCKDFLRQLCRKLDKPPYVCNACQSRTFCSLEKHFYFAQAANKEYRLRLSQARTGIALSEEEVRYLDAFVSPLLKQQQSPHHICVHNKDTIMVRERTLYRLINSSLFSARNIDLPRKVRFSARKQTVHVKVDRTCRIGRDFSCFNTFMKEHTDTPITQMDSVEGKKGGKVLLTIHFVKAEMMLAFLRDHNTSQSVIDIFERLYQKLGIERFMSLFKICLTDNGSEFSNPKAIELEPLGNRRTRVFYCDPSSPYQKGSAKRNHAFIRYFLPKGKDFSSYSQMDISLMNHINSYSRVSLGDKCPYDMFAFLYGKEMLDLLGCHKIPPQDVTLNKSIFRKEAAHDVR